VHAPDRLEDGSSDASQNGAPDSEPITSPSERLKVTGESAAFEAPPDIRPSPPPPSLKQPRRLDSPPAHWTRHVLGLGLELHVSDDADLAMRLRADEIVARYGGM
jgi:hypothetical protein